MARPRRRGLRLQALEHRLNFSAGLVAAYNFDQGSGSVLTDSSGNGNNGTIVNATWSTAGKYGDALSFNGTSALVNIPDATSLHLTTGMTLEAWVEPTAAGSNWQDVIYKGNDNYFLEASSDPGGTPAAGVTVGSADVAAYGTTALSANTWSFLTETYDGTTIRMYVNGVQVSSLAQSGSLLTSTDELQIGGDSLYGQYFKGLIDNVRIYNAALTAAQIQNDMNTPVSAGTTTPSTPTNLAAVAAGTGQINLSWTPSTDSVGVTGYSVWRENPGSTSFVQIGTATGTTYSDTGLTAGTYSYEVQAVDSAGNLSAFSNVASATATAAGNPGLVAAYNFDQGSGSVLTDFSGSGNNGTIVNAVWSTAGKFGDALSFNGTSALVNIPDATSLHLTTGMTLEAWVEPTAASSNWQDVIYKGNDNYYLEVSSNPGGTPAAGVTAGSADVAAYGTTALSASTWSFLTETYDGTTIGLYVNGVQVGSLAQSGSLLTSTDELQIGGDSLYGQYFKGLIDNVRIYNAALTAAQIQNDMNTPVAAGTTTPTAPANLAAVAAGTGQINLSWTPSTDSVGVTGYSVWRENPGSTSFVQIGTATGTTYSDTGLTAGTYSYEVQAVDSAGNLSAFSNVASATTTAAGNPGLVAAYNFDQGSGSVLTDSSGNGNNGTIVNATWSTAGKFGDALSFDGTSALVNIPDATSLHLTTGMTLEAWVEPTTAGNWQDVIYKGNDNYYLEASSNPGNTPAAGVTVGSADVAAYGTTSLSANTWSFLTETYDGTTIRLYVNGVQAASLAQSGSLVTSTDELQIGGDSLYGQYFKGLIDNVRIYNVALTAAQIQSDMNTPVAATTQTSYSGVLTDRNDNMRTGANLDETTLTPTNVNSSTFGKLFSYPLDGIAFASPLYVSHVDIPGMGYHNVVYVATEHDSVYAFDADGLSTTPLWHVSFINPAAGITPIPAADTLETVDIPNEVGITGTPVIDPTTGTIYLVADTKVVANGTTTYYQTLHALDITTGAEKFGGPVVIQATVPGNGSDAVNGMETFNPLYQNQHSGLLLSNGVVYVAFSSHGDDYPDWHGWVFGYNASTLQQVMVYNNTANGNGGGIWMGADGLATDSTGDIYLTTGNGDFDANTGGVDYGDSAEKITPSGTVVDYFTPYDQATLNDNDLDLNSGGLLLLPTQSGPYPDEMVFAAKGGTVYLVNRDDMGHYNSNNNNQIIQSLPNIYPAGNLLGNYSSPVYYDGNVYFGPVNGTVQAFSLTNGLLSTAPTSRSAESYSYPGGMMAISANGATNGILWAVQDTSTTTPGVLHAYLATNLSDELYNSNQAGSRDTMDLAAKFSMPTVANGKVYVGGVTQLTVYGLLEPPSAGPTTFTTSTADSDGSTATSNSTATVDTLPPVASPDTFVLGTNGSDSGSGAMSVLANDTSADGQSQNLAATLVSSTTNGTLTLHPDGSFVYTPGASFQGIDRFTYQVSENGTNGNTVTVTLLSYHASLVDKLYQQVLHRPAEDSGLIYWTSKLDAGEPLDVVATGIFNGAERLDPLVAQFYEEYLDRGTDPSGLAYWVNDWQTKGDPRDVVENILASQEFFNDAGDTDAGFINLLYQRVLQRAPQPNEPAYWLGLMSSPANESRLQIAAQFYDSHEKHVDLADFLFGEYFQGITPLPDPTPYITDLDNGETETQVEKAIIDSAAYSSYPPQPTAGTVGRALYSH